MITLKRLLLTRGFLISVVVIILFSILFGPSTYRKWQADKMVDELCAKDGGRYIYENVNLPADMYIPSEKNMKDRDEYYDGNERTWIIQGTGRFGELKLYKHHTKTYRRKDGKLLSEYITFVREGGDPIWLPVHPSSYICSEKSNQKIIVNSLNGGIK